MVIDTIRSAIEKEASEHEVVLVEAAIKGPAAKPIVELRFDSLAHPDAISAEELDQTTAWVSRLMDEIDPFDSSYSLEVSSPGLDRLLCTPDDFVRHLEDTVRLTCEVGERKKYTGTLLEVEGDRIVVLVDGTKYTIGMDTIKEARLKPSTDALFKRKEA